jgi:hypothetical protein
MFTETRASRDRRPLIRRLDAVVLMVTMAGPHPRSGGHGPLSAGILQARNHGGGILAGRFCNVNRTLEVDSTLHRLALPGATGPYLAKHHTPGRGRCDRRREHSPHCGRRCDMDQRVGGCGRAVWLLYGICLPRSNKHPCVRRWVDHEVFTSERTMSVGIDPACCFHETKPKINQKSNSRVDMQQPDCYCSHIQSHSP